MAGQAIVELLHGITAHAGDPIDRGYTSGPYPEFASTDVDWSRLDLNTLADALHRDPDTKALFHLQICDDMRRGSTPHELARILVRAVVIGGRDPAEIIETLIEAARSRRIKVTAVGLVMGLKSDAVIELGEFGSIVPISSLPRSGISDPIITGRKLSRVRPSAPPMETAIIASGEVELVPNRAQADRNPGTEVLHARLDHLKLLLPVVTGVPLVEAVRFEVTEIFGWSDFTRWRIHTEGADLWLARSTEGVDGDEVRRTARLVASMSEANQRIVQVAMVRHVAALLENDRVEKAIDIGIGLEALFGNDRQPYDPISMVVRTRGAWLLGADLARIMHQRPEVPASAW